MTEINRIILTNKDQINVCCYFIRRHFITVIPDEEKRIIREPVIPSSGIGKVQIGQKENIKLTGFRSLTFGILTGKISSISRVSGEDGYSVEIELQTCMKTSYSEQLKFIQKLDGTVGINISEKRVITRFMGNIKQQQLKAFKKQYYGKSIPKRRNIYHPSEN